MRPRLHLVAALFVALVLAWPQAGRGGERRCLRLLTLDNPKLAQELWQRAQAGQSLAALARQAGPQAQATAKVTCLDPEELEPQVRAAQAELQPGQVSPPLARGDKWVLLQLTTDEHWLKGQELVRRGQHAEAQEALLRDAALNPDGPAWRLLARVRLALRDQEGALKALDQALAWQPGDVSLLSDKALLLQDMGRREEALAQWEKALALQPDNPRLLQELAWNLVRQGRNLERAEKLARRASQLEPQRAAHHETLGLAQQARGNKAEAALSYHQALLLDPEAATAKANLPKCLLALDQATLARILSGQPEPGAKPVEPAQRPGRR